MKNSKKLVAHLIGINIFGLLISIATGLILGLFEALVVFPFAIMVGAFIAYSKYENERGSDSGDDEEKRLIISED